MFAGNVFTQSVDFEFLHSVRARVQIAASGFHWRQWELWGEKEKQKQTTKKKTLET